MESNELTLVVKELTIGTLVTNALDIKAKVEAKVATYNVDAYEGDEKQAAKDKAVLNASAKLLNDERIKLEKEWLKPFQQFKDVVTETTNIIKTASNKLDVIVKEKEEKEKEEKKAAIETIWKEKNFELITLDKVFSPKWLNKTYKLCNIKVEIESIIDTITKDLAALDAFGEDTSLLKDLYLTNLNLQATLQKGAELKANRERLAAMKAKQEEEKARQAALAAQEEEIQAEQEQEVETPAVEEPSVETETQSKEVETKQEPEQQVHKYDFITCGNDLALSKVRSIAEEFDLDFTTAIQLKGTIQQIENFKKRLTEYDSKYEKTNYTTLLIRNN